MDTVFHYVSIDSADDLSAVELGVSLAPDEEGIDATPADAPPGASELDAPAEGKDRYWWRVLVGPDAQLDPTGRPQPLTLYGLITDTTEVLHFQWVIGDPEPDVLPPFASDCWPVVIPSTSADEWAATPTDLQELAKVAAVSMLRGLVAGIVGGCPVEFRPCHPGCPESTWQPFPVGPGGDVSWQPVLYSGRWLNVGCSAAYGSCGCGSTRSRLELPAPVGRVDEVWVDGEKLDPAEYAVAGNHLYRVDGTSWPLTQNLGLPKTAAGTFAVVMLNAWPVDGYGALAAGLLAVEFAKGFGGQPCALPRNAIAVQRAGVSVTLDPKKSAKQAFPDGMTGIREVDVYVTRYNPHGLKTPPTVWSPDTR